MRLPLLTALFFLLTGCLALLAHTTDAGYTHLWALRPTSGAYWYYWLLAIAAALLFYRSRSLNHRIGAWTGRVLSPGRGTSFLAWFLLLGCGLLLLYFFRQRLFLAPPDGLGDSLLILEQVPVFTHLLGYLDSFDELLELYWHCKLYLYTSMQFGWHVEDAYAMLSIAAFAIYGSALYYFLIRRPLIEILAGIALLLFVPALQLFAGYVEHYTLATTWLTVTILLGAFALEGGQSPGAFNGAVNAGPINPALNRNRITKIAVPGVAALAAVAVLHHSIATVILPALVYLVWELADNGSPSQQRVQKTIRLGILAAAVALPILLAVWTWFLFFAEPPLAFFDSHISSPPVHRPGELFQPQHLRDILNLFFTASPAAVLLLACIFLAPRRRSQGAEPGDHQNPASSKGALATSRSQSLQRVQAMLAWLAPLPVHRFLLLATLGLGGLTFIIESLIGFPADWDLLTMYQFPLNLFLFYHIRHSWQTNVNSRPAFQIVLPLILAMNVFITISWIGRNAEMTVTSRQNIELARQNVSESLTILRQDPVYEQVARVTSDRKKTYIQVKLFFIRSRNRLLKGAGSFSPAERRELLDSLATGESSFHEWMLMPAVEFEARYEPLWKELSELNVRINSAD